VLDSDRRFELLSTDIVSVDQRDFQFNTLVGFRFGDAIVTKASSIPETVIDGVRDLQCGFVIE